MAGIYIHIPFCKQACHYCDFHFSTNLDIRAQMVDAIAQEATIQQSYLKGEVIQTVYFGGGTPSLLSQEEIHQLLATFRKNFTILPDAEISLEANPDDLTPLKLNALFDVGVNRLSIGIQSFDNRVLQFLNRSHDASSAVASVEHARLAGFKNISIDLIYAIPDQSESVWKQNIHQALALHPEHISSYSLTIEEKTVFGRWASKGKLAPVHDDHAASQLECLVTMLESAGFEQYEVSNFARPGFQSQHNSSYWKREKYLGLGPSAHSYNRESRQFNIANNHLYLKGLQSGSIPFTLEVLTQEDKVNDYLLTTLRTSWGADLAKLRDEFGYDLTSRHAAYLENLVSKKLATQQDHKLILTKSGLLLADKISSDLFI